MLFLTKDGADILPASARIGHGHDALVLLMYRPAVTHEGT